jgi:hypothetical protein
MNAYEIADAILDYANDHGLTTEEALNTIERNVWSLVDYDRDAEV